MGCNLMASSQDSPGEANCQLLATVPDPGLYLCSIGSLRRGLSEHVAGGDRAQQSGAPLPQCSIGLRSIKNAASVAQLITVQQQL